MNEGGPGKLNPLWVHFSYINIDNFSFVSHHSTCGYVIAVFMIREQNTEMVLVTLPKHLHTASHTVHCLPYGWFDLN